MNWGGAKRPSENNACYLLLSFKPSLKAIVMVQVSPLLGSRGEVPCLFFASMVPRKLQQPHYIHTDCWLFIWYCLPEKGHFHVYITKYYLCLSLERGFFLVPMPFINNLESGSGNSNILSFDMKENSVAEITFEMIEHLFPLDTSSEPNDIYIISLFWGGGLYLYASDKMWIN